MAKGVLLRALNINCRSFLGGQVSLGLFLGSFIFQDLKELSTKTPRVVSFFIRVISGSCFLANQSKQIQQSVMF
jgi:hypothetical protein